MPAGALETIPAPVPVVLTVRRTRSGGGVPLSVIRCRRSLPVSATTSVVALAFRARPCGAMN
jgi:hypothetical protein